ncbi:MAG: DUF2892 domain-containing protein [Sulfitobacter sp.]
MTANIGGTDRILRVLLGLTLVLAPLLNMPAIWSSAPFAYGSMAVGLVIAGTAALRFCPLYRIIGLSTCKL